MTKPFETIVGVLVASVEGMWDACGSEWSCEGGGEAPPPTNADVVVATIGFAADGLRGSLTALLPIELAAAALPEATPSTDIEALGDLVGEQSNMILGRMKNRLLSHGVSLTLGLPATAVARMVRVTPTDPDATSRWLAFDLRAHLRCAGQCFIRVDISFEEQFRLVGPAPRSSCAVAEEGEMVLF